MNIVYFMYAYIFERETINRGIGETLSAGVGGGERGTEIISELIICNGNRGRFFFSSIYANSSIILLKYGNYALDKHVKRSTIDHDAGVSCIVRSTRRHEIGLSCQSILGALSRIGCQSLYDN